MKLKDIRENRAAKVANMRALVEAADKENRSLSDDEQKQFDGFKAEVTDLEAQEQRASYLAEAERRMTGERVTENDGDFDAECRAFSLSKAIASQMQGNVGDGREREVSAELQRRAGRPFQGIAVPLQVFEQRVTSTTTPSAGPGSNIIATDHRGDLFIDRLRAALRIRQLGATVLNGLTGDVDIPRLKESATAGWVAENTALTASDHQFGKVQMTPKHAGALTEFSRNMIQQSSPDVEQLVRNDFAAILAEAVDLAAIAGTGTTQPQGIIGHNDVQTGTIATPTWDEVLGVIEQIEVADAMATGWLVSPKVVRTLRATVKDSNGAAGYLMNEPGNLGGYNALSSTLVPVDGTNDVGSAIFGNWSDLLIGYWSAFDLLVNPYAETAYSKGNVQVRAMLTCDVAVRHGESFVTVDDVPVA